MPSPGVYSTAAGNFAGKSIGGEKVPVWSEQVFTGGGQGAKDVAVVGTPELLASSTACDVVWIKAKSTNSGPVAWGFANTIRALAVSEVQVLTPGGTISGGSWTMTANGQTASGIAYNAAATAIQSAIVAAGLFGAVDVVVSGGPISTGAVTLTFRSGLGNIAQVVVSAAALTGSTPSLTPSTTTSGVAAIGDTLEAGEKVAIPVDNLSRLWVDAAVAGNGVTYTYASAS